MGSVTSLTSYRHPQLQVRASYTAYLWRFPSRSPWLLATLASCRPRQGRDARRGFAIGGTRLFQFCCQPPRYGGREKKSEPAPSIGGCGGCMLRHCLGHYPYIGVARREEGVVNILDRYRISTDAGHTVMAMAVLLALGRTRVVISKNRRIIGVGS